jgi:glycosyltransferase involved in cell wall biosynthesis
MATHPTTITTSDVRAAKPDVAVIVPVSERYDDVAELYYGYRHALEAFGCSYEFTYVLDGHFPEVLKQLGYLQDAGEPVRIIKLARWFGEATALTAGFQNSNSDIILTLPAYHQVEPSEIGSLLRELDTHDMVVARRYPRIDSRLNRIQTTLFNWLLRVVTGTTFHDLGCGVRAFKRQVATEIPVYGDQHRFLPVLASGQGFRIKEIDLAQSPRDQFRRIYRLGIYPRRILDMLTVFFLVKFTKKPLRFFGLIGVATFTTGALITFYLVVQRLFFGVGLAERPALLLSSLLMVLGVQVFALGLIGELIIFTHAKHIKEYTIEEIIN